MYKVSTDLLVEITKTLDASLVAIHRLERQCKYKNVHIELRERIYALSRDIKSRYCLDELVDPKAREAKLEKAAQEAHKDFKKYKKTKGIG